MPTRLMRVKSLLNNAVYYVDWLLFQLRNVDNPHDYEQFANANEMADFLTNTFCMKKMEVV
jgi:hypothetical protein